MSPAALIAAPDSVLVADLCPSPNIEPRFRGLEPTILVLHYTGLESVRRSLEVLSRPDCRVSCHYVIDVDGRIVQIDTPAGIVRRPADQYVADFVSGISELKLLRAADIMKPLNGTGVEGPRACR